MDADMFGSAVRSTLTGRLRQVKVLRTAAYIGSYIKPRLWHVTARTTEPCFGFRLQVQVEQYHVDRIDHEDACGRSIQPLLRR
jgi:hypothetical protein